MDIFQKDFDKWIEKKKSLHFKVVIPPLFKERDIWWINRYILERDSLGRILKSRDYNYN